MKKEELKYFGLSDYLEEEQYLQEQHRSGWKMTGSKKLGWVFVFEKCEPEEYIYQLDFIEEGQVGEDYFQLFEDCGWEYFHKLNGWHYFRKRKSEDDNENSIFNDAASRAEMAKKVMRSQWVVLLPILIVFSSFTSTFSYNSDSIFWMIFFIIYAFLTAALVVLSLRIYWKLNKIIAENEPI
ncbi:DUF2812 domain-containing protein [Enterococcus sp. BWM-S5]|uniref:DUF2812 domain-containing protein n=1 Tax=Enterococcus larvae TaxID=2794352 RepID=A0ABS4CJD8_9ENTE|nr:DUF2812 domain-containing protein [Enterococcus larvae]MBP1046580.1 DUF2812 domain-containing protein [Enterococcus larvae]